MKNLLLLFVILISACADPTYTLPGMSYKSFDKLCNVTGEELINARSTTTTQSTTFTLALGDAPGRRDKGCVGTFVFINDKLDSITR